MRTVVNIEGNVEPAAVRVLDSVPGIEVSLEPVSDARADAVIRSTSGTTLVLIEFKRTVNAANVWQLVQRVERSGDIPLFVVAQYVTREASNILARHDIAYVDGSGNAHIDLPGLVFHREVPSTVSKPVASKPPVRLSGKAGVVAQLLLLELDRAWQVKELAERAEVSAGLAHRVLSRLEDEGVVEVEGEGPSRVRHVSRAGALLDLFAEENDDRSRRTRGFCLAQTPRALARDVSSGLDAALIEHAITGPAAAALIAPAVTSIPVVSVWVTERLPAETILETCKAEAVSSGHNLVFLQARSDVGLAFRVRRDRTWLANPFRVYADLLREPQRGREQAEKLRHEVIRW